MPEPDSISELSVITRPTLRSRGTSSGPKTQPHHPPSQPPPGPPSNPSLLPWYDISTLSLLALGSFFGTLIRIGLTALFDNPGSAVFPVAWVQGTGGFLFGFIVHRRKEIERVWPAAYVALRVGFSGGIATFATWQLNSFTGFSNLEGNNENWLDCACNGLSYIWITITVMFFSINFGRHVSSHLPRTTLPPLPLPYRITLTTFSLLAWLALLLTFLLTSYTTWRTGRRLCLTLLIAPPATWIRWWAGSRLNPISPSYIRLGTFGCNMLSTSVAGVMFLLQRLEPFGPGLGLLPCQSLQSVQDGFCGCLSTIPAAIEQAEKMHDSGSKHATLKAWCYLAFTYLCGTICVVLTLGIGWWASPGGLGTACVY